MAKLIIFTLLIVALIECSTSSYHRGHSFSQDNLNDLRRQLINELKSRMYATDSSTDSFELDQSDENDGKSEYKQFFGYLINNQDEDKVLSRNNRIEKRFLKSLIDVFFSKNRTKPKEDFFDNQIFDQTTKPYFTTPSTTSYKTIKKEEVHSATDDAFYKLKIHCSRNYDDLCYSKRKEMYELVKKCDRLNNQHKNSELKVCREVLSIYCYVFFSRDLLTCFGTDYDQYIPGKKYSNESPSTTTNRYTTPSTRRISINFVTTTRTSTWYKPIILSSSKTSPSTASTTTKFTTTSTKASNDLENPFEGSVLTIPKDAEKLKKIGNYCLKTKQKEPNCDKMLVLLKEKFKGCEKKPKIDNDCQTFKFQFCSAFNNFPCCPDVLAGRTCSGKAIN